MTLGKKIRHLRLEANLSQFELEQRTGIKREYLSRLENERLKNVTLKTLRKLGKGLRVNPAIFLTDDPQILIGEVIKMVEQADVCFEHGIKIAWKGGGPCPACAQIKKLKIKLAKLKKQQKFREEKL